MKRLVLCLDGTWNSVSANTNVWRMRQLIAPADAAGTQQLAYYTEGVGTARGERLRGGALGYGLDDDVVAAYRWLMGRHDAKDQIFLFGFSRGAYTARSLAGMIAVCGLLRPSAPLSVEELYARYQLGRDAKPIWSLYRRNDLTAAERRLLRHSRRVPVRMIGVWDTVGALGIPFGNFPGLSRKRFRFHNTRLSDLFEHAYQALAIDEHRAAFKPAPWTIFTPSVPDPPGKRRPRSRVVEQRWFAGAHANVGGGIAGDDMAQLPLAWMMQKASGLGLAFRGSVDPAGHEALAPISDSYAQFMQGFYRLATLGRRYYRPIGEEPRAVSGGSVRNANETIDASVFARWRGDDEYRPPNLIAWAKARNIDPAASLGSIDAVTGAPLI